MEEKNLTEIKFSSFVKLCSAILFSLGMALGLTLFIISLFGGDVTASLGSIHLTGIAAGVASIIISPVAFTLFGLILGVLGFLPFKLLLKITRVLKINVKFEESPHDGYKN